MIGKNLVWVAVLVGVVACCKPAVDGNGQGEVSAPPVAAPADVGKVSEPAEERKRILPKGRSLVKLRSTRKDVQLVMPEFGNCIVQLQKDGAVSGPRLTLEMHVDAAGKVTRAMVAEASQSIPEFEACIIEKAQALVLPEGAPDRVLRLPFDFGMAR